MKRPEKFNDCRAMDITEWHKNGEKKMLLHMIDEFSRLSVAKLIPDKRPETVMNFMFTNWFCVFGSPRRVIHDKGGEFLNQRVANLLNVMGVRVLSSPFYSPFVNGIVERNNGILKHKMDKMKGEYLILESPGLESQHIGIPDEWVKTRVNEIVAARKAVL